MSAHRLRLVIYCVCTMLFVGSAAPAPAQSFWTGGSGTPEWSNAGNWTAVPASSSTTLIDFPGNLQLNTSQNIANPFDLNSLTFESLAGAYVINTGALRFQANGATPPVLTKDTNATITFNNPVIFNATGSMGGTGTGSLVFSPLTVAQGTLTISRNNVSANSLTVQTGATIAPASPTTSIGTLTVGGGGASITGSYAADIAAGTSSDLLAISGSLTLGAASTLTISGTASGSTYTLANYSSVTGTFATVNNLPAGYTLVYGPTSLQMVPEPAMILALCAAGAGVVGWCRRDYRSRRRVIA